MPTPTIPDGELFFNATLWTGNGTTQNITNGVAGQSFQPDFLWVKERSEARSNLLWDSVRGSNLGLITNTTSAESAQPSFTGFLSNGFGISNTDSSDITNKNAQTYVGWNWKAGGAAVTNTDGTISSQVSANTTSGFSIVTYTGTGANATVGHGLGVTPKWIIVKNRDATDAWQVYHAANTANPETDYLVLNTTAATADAADRWNDTLPTSTVFSIGNGVEVNTNTEKYVAYCWAEIAGFSAFGSYTGNGSTDGTFVYLGFRPKFLMMKRTNLTSDWIMYDTSRSTYNVNTISLNADLADAEYTASDNLDILSNGFKCRSSASSPTNVNGSTYIYMAFAENPFKNANAR